MFNSYERLGLKVMKYLVVDWLYHSFEKLSVGSLAQYARNALGSDMMLLLFNDWWPVTRASKESKVEAKGNESIKFGHFLLACLAEVSILSCANLVARKFLTRLTHQQLKGFSDHHIISSFFRILKSLRYEEKSTGTAAMIRCQSKTDMKDMFELSAVAEDMESAKTKLICLLYEKIMKENFCSYRITLDYDRSADLLDEDGIVLFSDYADDETASKLSVLRMFLKNNLPEEPMKQEAASEAGDEPKQITALGITSIKNALWKETKKLLRDYRQLKDLTDEQVEEAQKTGWVPMDAVCKALEVEGLTDEKLAQCRLSLTEQSVVSFMESHDVIERLAFKDDYSKGRALYYHVQGSGVDLESQQEVFKLLHFTGSTEEELELYMKTEGIMTEMVHGMSSSIAAVQGSNGRGITGININMSKMCVCVASSGLEEYERYHSREGEGHKVKDHIRLHVFMDIKALLRGGWKLRMVHEKFTRKGAIVLIRLKDNEQFILEGSKVAYIPVPNPVHVVENGKRLLYHYDSKVLANNKKLYEERKSEQEESMKEKGNKEKKDHTLETSEGRLRKHSESYSGEENERKVALELGTDVIKDIEGELEAMLSRMLYREVMRSEDKERGVTLLVVEKVCWLEEFVANVLFEGSDDFSGYYDHTNIVNALQPNSLIFDRLEFLGDSVLDLFVARDCHDVDRKAKEISASLSSFASFFMVTTQNGHNTDTEVGLLPITRDLFKKHEYFIMKNTSDLLADRKKKIYGDVLEAIIGGMYLDPNIGLTRTHERVRYLFRKYGASGEKYQNLYSAGLRHHECFDDSDPDAFIPLLEKNAGKLYADCLLARFDNLHTPQGTERSAGARRGGGASKSSIDFILNGLKKIDRTTNKPAWSTHFKFESLASSYVRSYTNTEVYTRMIKFADRRVIGYTNEAISQMSRLAIDLDGISSEEIIFPNHAQYGGWTLAEIIHQLVAERMPGYYNMTIVLDISRPNKASQHMHWPCIPMMASDIFIFLSSLQVKFCELESEYREADEANPSNYKKDILMKLKCMDCSQQNDPRPAECYVSDGLHGVFKCITCKTQKKNNKKRSQQIEYLQGADVEVAFKDHLMTKWAEYIDAGMFTSRKLRMYLSDKFDEEAVPQGPKGYPVHQKKIYLHAEPTAVSKPQLLYNFHDEKPVHHTYAVPIPHMDMLRLVSLRHPTYMMSYHHNFAENDEKLEGFWHPAPLPDNLEHSKDIDDEAGIDALFSGAVTLCELDEHKIDVTENKYDERKDEWESPFNSYEESCNQMFQITVECKGYQRRELWQAGEMLLCVERREKELDQKFKVEVTKLLEPRAARDYYDNGRCKLAEIWNTELCLSHHQKEQYATFSAEEPKQQTSKGKSKSVNKAVKKGAKPVIRNYWELSDDDEESKKEEKKSEDEEQSPKGEMPKEEPQKEVIEPKIEEPKKEEPKKEEPKQEPKKEEPKKEEPKKEEPTKEEPNKPERDNPESKKEEPRKAENEESKRQKEEEPQKKEELKTENGVEVSQSQRITALNTQETQANEMEAKRQDVEIKEDKEAVAPETANGDVQKVESEVGRKAKSEKERREERDWDTDTDAILNEEGSSHGQFWIQRGSSLVGRRMECVPLGPSRVYYMLGFIKTVDLRCEKVVFFVNAEEQAVLQRVMERLNISWSADFEDDNASVLVYQAKDINKKKSVLDGHKTFHLVVSCLESLQQIVVRCENRSATVAVLLTATDKAEGLRDSFFAFKQAMYLHFDELVAPKPLRGYHDASYDIVVHIPCSTIVKEHQKTIDELRMSYVNTALRSVRGFDRQFKSHSDVVKELRQGNFDRRTSLQVQDILLYSMQPIFKVASKGAIAREYVTEETLLITETMSTMSGVSNLEDSIKPRQITYKDLPKAPPCRYFSRAVLVVSDKKECGITREEVHSIFSLLRPGGHATFILSNVMLAKGSTAAPQNMDPIIRLNTLINQVMKCRSVT
eukprot:TRINITY_DN8940_c0_g2_i1.p1 TRINITY_DN8940_c0_g2~~TRINITY_DN8940_c0_g2_i1.p1  ORF type:complete len:2022 (+),score=410.10 TRINITY_DN8940_c0_g2_i1:172-6066(+)